MLSSGVLVAHAAANKLLCIPQDSAHFKNEQRKQAQIDAKIAQLKAKAAAFSPAELAGYEK